ncbi:Ribosome-releasing factor 2, mitochondrial [Batrachochytrium dendrobatidis]|nr:Ribosome-releasing factor 2, mitochondrial [Batrachochytrium dendrobatidis]
MVVYLIKASTMHCSPFKVCALQSWLITRISSKSLSSVSCLAHTSTPWKTARSYPSEFSRPCPTRIHLKNTNSCLFSASAHSQHSSAIIDPKFIRNLGIIAHIDAGKTTTTERMLYYVGYTKRLGNVDEGSTVTDYLKTEKERGITIQSACIPLAWKNHRLNLIDTPGHVDFTIEVERSLRVLDGAVCVLDGVAGVEAQTETVWAQSNRYSIPRIAFVNKLDRDGASFKNTVHAMSKRLGGWGKPAIIQLPIFRNGHGVLVTDSHGGGKLEGIVDLLTMERLDWFKDPSSGGVVTRSQLTLGEREWALVYEDAVKYRNMLIETLSEMDDGIVNVFLECDGDHAQVPAKEIQNACRRATISGQAVPVLCGASFRNIGVQPILDAIVNYLPSPMDAPSAIATLSNGSQQHILLKDPNMTALAFKVVHDSSRGPLVYVRVYSGTLESRSILHIAGSSTGMGRDCKPIKERATKLLELYADDYDEIPLISAGNIGAIVGLKHVKTGDTLLASTDKRAIQLHSIPIPPPVFVRSCEAESISSEKAMAAALESLCREDPSLTVTVNDETGQTLLSGMGELHLEIAGERLQEVYNVKCNLGKVEISYRETLQAGQTYSHEMVYDSQVFGKHFKCTVELEMESIDNTDAGESISLATDGIIVDARLKEHQITLAEDGRQLTAFAPLSELSEAAEMGIRGALSRGPILGLPVSQVSVRVKQVSLFNPEISTPSSVRTAAYNCVRAIFQTADKRIIEPVMDLSVRVANQYVGSITKDLTGTRKGQVLGVNAMDLDGADSNNSSEKHVIHARVPLAGLVGYSSQLRALTAGTGEFLMALHGYEPMSHDKEELLIRTMRGY